MAWSRKRNRLTGSRPTAAILNVPKGKRPRVPLLCGDSPVSWWQCVHSPSANASRWVDHRQFDQVRCGPVVKRHGLRDAQEQRERRSGGTIGDDRGTRDDGRDRQGARRRHPPSSLCHTSRLARVTVCLFSASRPHSLSECFVTRGAKVCACMRVRVVVGSSRGFAFSRLRQGPGTARTRVRARLEWGQGTGWT